MIRKIFSSRIVGWDKIIGDDIANFGYGNYIIVKTMLVKLHIEYQYA